MEKFFQNMVGAMIDPDYVVITVWNKLVTQNSHLSLKLQSLRK